MIKCFYSAIRMEINWAWSFTPLSLFLSQLPSAREDLYVREQTKANWPVSIRYPTKTPHSCYPGSKLIIYTQALIKPETLCRSSIIVLSCPLLKSFSPGNEWELLSTRRVLPGLWQWCVAVLVLKEWATHAHCSVVCQRTASEFFVVLFYASIQWNTKKK